MASPASDDEVVLVDDLEDEAGGGPRPGEEDDFGLLDWEQYARIRRRKVFGIEMPAIDTAAQSWWHGLPRRMRRFVVIGAVSVVLVVLLGIIAGAAAGGKSAPTTGPAAPAAAPGTPAPAPVPAAAHEYCEWVSYRLPADVVPSHYRLELRPTIARERGGASPVAGRVAVAVDVRKPGGTQCIVMHSVGMRTISRVAVRAGAGEEREGHVHKGLGEDANDEVGQVVFHWDGAPLAGTVEVVLEFEYEVSDELRGFYKSAFKDPDGQWNAMGTTQFESVEARRAFPCFDEPGMKATFDVTLTVEAGLKALFNTKEVARADAGDGRVSITYQRTPRMSTYLVAFIIGDLAGKTRRVGHCTLGVWGTPTRSDQLDAALDAVAKILPAYEKLFGVPFPMDKLDLVAIPDFAAGAMENWGLITYRETAMLTTEAHHSLKQQQRVAVVIAHEMAHQWFGNLVTMEWWNDLWLNEGFATFVEYLGTDVARPGYHYLELFPTYDLTGALETDSLPSTRALHTPTSLTESASGIDSQFDSIAYNKGGSVIRMIRTYMAQLAGGEYIGETSLAAVGADPFMDGIRAYLRQYEYGNAESDQLWETIQRTTNYPVVQWMQGYTDQKGYPLITLEWGEGGAAGGQLVASQTPFLKEGAVPCAERSWWVPLSVSTRSQPADPAQPPVAATAWKALSGCGRETVVERVDFAKGDLVKANHHQSGYYRVNYPGEGWASLVDHVYRDALSPLDVAGLVDDARALSDGFQLNSTVALDLIAGVAVAAPAYQPWLAALRTLGRLRKLLSAAGDSACLADLEAWRKHLVKLPVQAVGTAERPGESHAERLLRPLLLGAAGSYGDASVAQFADGLYKQLVAGTEIAPDFRALAYGLAAESGDRAKYVWLRGEFEKASDAAQLRELSDALTSVETAELMDETLRYALSDKVRSQDTVYMIVDLSRSSDAGLRAAWAFVQANFLAIARHGGGVGAAGAGMSTLINRVGSQFGSEAAVREVEALYERFKDQGLVERVIAQTKESIRANVRWVERNKADTCAWLRRAAAGLEDG